MKKLIVLSFVAALSVAGCSKKKADTTPTNTTPTTEEKAADPAAARLTARRRPTVRGTTAARARRPTVIRANQSL